MGQVLFITGHEFLYHPQNGGQKTSLRNYRLLQSVYGKANVELCMFSNYEYIDVDNSVHIISTHKNKFELLINTLCLRNVCNHNGLKNFIWLINTKKWDFIFVDSSTIGYIIKKSKIKAPIIVFYHNIEKNYAFNKVKNAGIAYIVAFVSYWINEMIITKMAKKIILLNDRDNLELQKLYGRKADYILPITFEDIVDERELQEYKFNIGNDVKLLFVGSKFEPNIDGITWFVENVMKHLNSKFKLQIVGKGMEHLKNKLSRNNVEVIGTVESLNQYYYEADAVVLPIFYGDGMKVKTAEAMMYGKRIFATDEALEGYNIGTTENIFRCNDTDTFVSCINNIENWHNRYNIDVRENYKENYDTKVIKNNFKKFIFDQL